MMGMTTMMTMVMMMMMMMMMKMKMRMMLLIRDGELSQVTMVLEIKIALN